MDPAALRAPGDSATCVDAPKLVDEAVRAFADAVPGATDGGVAVVAVGGYGRGELFPGSDVDLVILHTEGTDRLAERVAEAVLYPLWDLGLATGNAVRTDRRVPGCGREADPRALAALLDARLVAGSGDLLRRAQRRRGSDCRADPARFVAVLRRAAGRAAPPLGTGSCRTRPSPT